MSVGPFVQEYAHLRSGMFCGKIHRFWSSPKPAARLGRRLSGLKALVIAASLLAGSSVSMTPPANAQDMQPGDAVVTRFSGTVEQGGRRVIDPDGAVASILDLRQAGGPPRGEHWFDELQSGAVTAAEIGQVFGVALDDATPPSAARENASP